MQLYFKHLDLREVEGRLDPEKKPSARGRMYWHTEPGMADTAFRVVVLLLIEIWKAEPGKILRISDIENHPDFPANMAPRIPATVKRLARMQQLKLDFDRDGVLIDRGSAWIET